MFFHEIYSVFSILPQFSRRFYLAYPITFYNSTSPEIYNIRANHKYVNSAKHFTSNRLWEIQAPSFDIRVQFFIILLNF